MWIFLDSFTEDEIDDYLSVLLEYGRESKRTLAFLQEYGKEIMTSNVFKTVRKYFL